jgi:hypothetical protein
MEAPPIEVPDSQKPPPMSLAARLINIFVAPGEVFDDIKAGTPKPANWLTPLVVSMLIGIVASFIMFSQPSLLQRLREERDKAIQKAVDSGSMTQQVADKQTELLDKIYTPTVMKVLGTLQAILAGLLWLLGTFILKGRVSYMQIVEMVATTMLIAVLGGVLKLLLIIIYGNLAVNAGPILLISKFDPKNTVHVLLAGIDVTELWNVGVLSLGLAKLSEKSFWKCAVWIYGVRYGLWLLAILVFMRFAAAK